MDRSDQLLQPLGFVFYQPSASQPDPMDSLKIQIGKSSQSEESSELFQVNLEVSSTQNALISPARLKPVNLSFNK